MAGYSPASVVVSNLPQSQVIYYSKDFIRNLKAHTPFVRCSERRSLPAQSGNQYRLFMYQPFGSNIQQAAEGTVGSGITPTVSNATVTIGQYADYANISDLAKETALDNVLESLEREMAYRLGLSLNIIARNTADGASAVDSSVNSLNAAANNVYLTRQVLTSSTQALRGRNVMPFDMGSNSYVGVIHPYLVGDVLNDGGANGLVDIYKHTSGLADRLEELPESEDGKVPVLEFSGLRFWESSICSTSTIGGKTALRTYVFGDQGLISIELAVPENSQMGKDADWHNMRVWMKTFDEPSVADGSRLIGGLVSYNVKYSATLPTTDTIMRLRFFDYVPQSVT